MSRAIDYRAELQRLAQAFEAAVGDLRPRGESALGDRGMRLGNVAVLLPQFLVEGAPFAECLEAARTLSLANALLTSHFLSVDRWMDGDARILPRAAWLSDRCLALAGREHARLFPPESAFWRHHDRYVNEYFESLEWERDVLWTEKGAEGATGSSLDGALLHLGRKISPIKTAAAGVALLAGCSERLPVIEKLVDDFHAAYQLSDDLADVGHDLAAGHPSVPAWTVARMSGLDKPPREADQETFLALAVECGALDEIGRLIGRHYDQAVKAAVELGATTLSTHLALMRDGSQRYRAWMSRRLRIVRVFGTGPAQSPEPATSRPSMSRSQGGGSPRGGPCSGEQSLVHSFVVRGRGFVFDPGSVLLLDASRAAADVLAWEARGRKAAELDVLRTDHGPDAVDGAVAEVALLAGSDADRAAPPGLPPEHPACDGAPSISFAPRTLVATSNVVCLAIDVTDGCNLACDYCYLAGRNAPSGRFMTDGVAFRAVDLLFRESTGEPRLSLVFLGGEPLLAPGLIATVVRHARRRAETSGRRVSFHMTTNGTLLTPDVASELVRLGVTFMVSLDGGRESHDRCRSFPDGRGSFDIIAANVRRLPPGVPLQARATVTQRSAPLPALVAELSALGFTTVHLSPVSAPDTPAGFADRLLREFEDLAQLEMDALSEGRPLTVGNFIEGIAALESGPGRLLPCGAGTRYICVGPDGTLFLCHRFVGDAPYAVGDVGRGVDREAVARVLERAWNEAAECRRCWARPLCGGPCFHDLAAAPRDCGRPDGSRCRIRTRVLELSMWLYAALPEASRRRIVESARGRSRPEFAARLAAGRMT